MNFNEIKNQSQLEDFFCLSTEQLKYLMVPLYKCFKISKKNGGKREISQPFRDLLIFQKRISVELNRIYTPIAPNFVYGLIKKSNNNQLLIKSNAIVHQGSNYIINVDIKDFFNSINSSKVFKLFSSELFNFDAETANILTSLVTYKQSLVTGSPTSPVISNFIFLELDYELFHFSKSYGGNYTRYVDDLTISFNTIPDKNFLIDLQHLLSKSGYYLNQNKINVRGKDNRQVVNGLTVNKYINVPKEYLKNLRATLNNFTNKDFDIEFEKYVKVNLSRYIRYKKKRIKYYYGEYYGYDFDFEVNLDNYKDDIFFRKQYIFLTLLGKLIFIGKI